MKKSPKFSIRDIVVSKQDLSNKLEVLLVKDMGKYYAYRVLDTYGRTHVIDETMLLEGGNYLS